MFVQLILCLYIFSIIILLWQNCIMEQDYAAIENKYFEIFLIGQILLCSVTILIYMTRKNKKTTTPSLDVDFVYNTECPICFNEFISPIKSDCGHGYCIECLHTFWKKRTWKNLCPLCRQSLNNLRLIENEDYKYLESTKEMLLQKIGEMSKPHYRGFKFSDLFTETAYYFIIGTLLLILWTWAVVNNDKLIYYALRIYNSFYNTKRVGNS